MAVSIVASIDQAQSGLDADCDFTVAGWTPAADDVVVFWCASQNANATIVVPTGRGYPLGGNTRLSRSRLREGVFRRGA
jgi:hypothetical protein